MDTLDGTTCIFWSMPDSNEIKSYVEMKDNNGDVCLVAGQPPPVNATVLSRPAIIDRLGQALLADRAAWAATDAGRVESRQEKVTEREANLAALKASGLDDGVAEAILPDVTPYEGGRYVLPSGIEQHLAVHYLLTQEEVGTVFSYLVE